MGSSKREIKMKQLDKLICEEVNVLEFIREIGQDGKGKIIKIVYSLKEDNYYWLHGEERKEVKNIDKVMKLIVY